eukprot:RCo043903
MTASYFRTEAANVAMGTSPSQWHDGTTGERKKQAIGTSTRRINDRIPHAQLPSPLFAALPHLSALPLQAADPLFLPLLAHPAGPLIDPILTHHAVEGNGKDCKRRD